MFRRSLLLTTALLAGQAQAQPVNQVLPFSQSPGLSVQYFGDSNASIGMHLGKYPGGSGSSTYSYVMADQNAVKWAVDRSNSRLFFDTSIGYQPTLSAGNLSYGIPFGCVVESAGLGYSTADTINWSDATTSNPTVGPGGALTGCGVSASVASGATITSVTSSAGYGGFLLPKIGGVGTFGEGGDITAGVLSRVSDVINTSAKIVVVTAGADDLVMGSSQTASFTTTLNSPILTVAAVPYGFIPGENISGTNIPAGAYILSVNSKTQITISANATAAGTNTAVVLGIAPQVIEANLTSIFNALLNARKTVVATTIVPQIAATFVTYGLNSTQIYQFNARRQRVNAWLRSYVRQKAAANPSATASIILADPEAVMIDSTNGQNLGLSSLIAADNTHRNALGSYLIGDSILTALNTIIGSQSFPPRSFDAADFYDPIYNPAGNLVGPVVLFTGTTNGTTSVTAVTVTQGTFSGTLEIFGPGIPVGTTGTLSGSTITLSAAATASATGAPFAAAEFSAQMLGTGGTVSTGFTGTAPTGTLAIKTAGNGTGTYTSAVVAKTDGTTGNLWNVTMTETGSTTADAFTLAMPYPTFPSPAIYGLVAGDIVYASCHIAVSNAANVTSLAFEIIDDDSTAADLFALSSNLPPASNVISASWNADVVTPPMPIHASMTQLYMGFLGTFAATATTNSLTLSISNCSMHKANVQ